jgi:hypothetical protein
VVRGEHTPDVHDRVAVRLRFHRRVRADHRVGAAAVVDEHLLAPYLGQSLTDEPRGERRAAARRVRHDVAYGPVRIILLCKRGCGKGDRCRECKASRSNGIGCHRIPPPR